MPLQNETIELWIGAYASPTDNTEIIWHNSTRYNEDYHWAVDLGGVSIN